MTRSLRATLVALSFVVASAAAAQPAPAGSVENVYARPGYPTVGVYVMGSVTTPGKWRVEDGAPLLDLLAVTQPVTPVPTRGGVREVVHVRLYRQPGAGARQLTLDSELDPLLLGAQAATPLREGDLVQVAVEVIEPRRRASFTDILSVVTTITSLAVLGISLAR